MDPTRLTNTDWWESGPLEILESPFAPLDTKGLSKFLSDHAPDSSVVVPTSGSEGVPKFICLTRAALLASAASVNRHLHANSSDRWLCALPTFHVGGLGIYARAIAAGGSVTATKTKWDATEFAETCQAESTTQTSLTPTQVHDLVEHSLEAPTALRSIVVGGGALSNSLRDAALALGWPLLRSYGMTESASQIATERLDRDSDGWLDALDLWELSVSEAHGCLRFRGDAACTGWASRNAIGDWRWTAATQADGWVTTRDLVELSEDRRRLRFLDRADDQIKILGELVSLRAVRARFGNVGTVVARPQTRKGYELVAIVETTDQKVAEAAVSAYNKTARGLERIETWESRPALPRTSLGKILHRDLT